MTLYHVLKDKTYDIQYLVTTCSEEYDRISMHGVRVSLLKRQAEKIGIPLKIIYLPVMPTMQAYDSTMAGILAGFKDEGIGHSIFGDIFLEDLRKYREARLAEAGFQGVFPLWKRPSQELVREFMGLGFKSILVCTDESSLDASFCGRMIDEQLLADLPPKVDPCGENGEFHSFVFDGPIFTSPVNFTIGEKVRCTYTSPDRKSSDTAFWYCDLLQA